MKEKLELLKKLGFSDSFLKVIENHEIQVSKTIEIDDTGSIPKETELICPDITSLIIEKTSPPSSIIFKSVPN